MLKRRRFPFAARPAASLPFPALRAAAFPAAALLAAVVLSALLSSASALGQAPWTPPSGAGRGDAPWTLERVSERVWRISIANREPEVELATGENLRARITVPGYDTRDDGAPLLLPVRRFLFGVPPGGSLSVRVLAQKEERTPPLASLEGYASAPAAAASAAASAAAAAASAAAAAQQFIRRPAPMDRGSYVEQAVEICPVVLVEGARALGWLRSATIEITITGALPPSVEDAAAGAAAPLPMAGFLVNAGEVARWPRIPGLRTAADSWIAPGSSALRIGYTEEGVYRIRYEDLVAAGFLPSGIDPVTLRLLVGGEEIPLRMELGTSAGSFDPGDYLDYWAPRHAGERGAYHDLWSDENAAFLVWGGAAGRRLTALDATPAGTAAFAFYQRLLHLEADRVYHFGDTDETDAARSEYTPGECWAWKYLLKNDTVTAPFALPPVSQDPARLVYRVKASSRDSSRGRVTLNGAAVDEFRLGNNGIAIRSVALPVGLLHAGENRIVVENVPLVICPDQNPTCTIERFYLDWIDVVYPDSLAAQGRQFPLDASVAWDSVSAPLLQRITLRGLAGTRAFAVNRTRAAYLTGLRESGAGAALEAEALVNNSESYVFYSDSSVLRPPRMEVVTIPDPAPDGRNADYLVVTHRAFLAQAQRLAAYRRQADGYRVAVADVEDLYTVYTYGRKHPDAIRDYVRDCYDNAAGAKPRFLLLLGDASWDAMFHRADAVKTDFVPTYGCPASDNYFVSRDWNSGDATPLLAVGRIPAETAQDAAAVIDKTLEYEALPPSDAQRRILFSVGGKDPSEQPILLGPVRVKISRWVQPHCLEPRLIIKKVKANDNPVTYDDLDTLTEEINRGVLWFYFTGHGGSRIIDVGIDRPELFSLKGRYPFFITLSCNTAHFSEPYETGINERFAMAAENGAIASYGTSGLGEIYHDEMLADGLFEGMLDSNLVTYGDLAAHSKRRLISRTGGSDWTTRNTVHQYALLGDPASRIPLPAGMELGVQAADISTEPAVLTEGQATAISTVIHSSGRCVTDSVDLRLRVTRDGATVLEETRRIAPFLWTATETWNTRFAGVTGSVTIAVTIDPDNRLAELSKANNTASITRAVLPRGTGLIFPLDAAVVPAADSVAFVVAHPADMPDPDVHPRLQVQVDRSPVFDASPRERECAAGPVFTRFPWAPGDLPADSVLYWRARLVKDQATEDWSGSRSFIRRNAGVATETWKQDDSAQFARSTLERARSGAGWVDIGNRPIDIDVLSAGSNQIEVIIAVLRVDGADYALNARGFNVLAIDRGTGRVKTSRVFDTYAGTAEAAAMTQFLDALPADDVIAVAVKDDANGYPPVLPGGTNITAELRAMLGRFGAQHADSIGFRDSYALVGSKANPAAAAEMHLRYGVARAGATMIVQSPSARILSPPVGPANSWQRLGWNAELPQPAGSVAILVHGVRNGGDTLLLAALDGAAQRSADLSTIDAAAFPFLRFEALLGDTLYAGSPRLHAWEAAFESRFPELGLTRRVVTLPNTDSLMEGTPLRVAVTLQNAGRSAALNVPIVLSLPEHGSTHRADTVLPTLPMQLGEATVVNLEVPTAGLRGVIPYEVSVGGEASGMEYFFGNNVYASRASSYKDGVQPALRVLFDGVEIADDDYIAPSPLIMVKLEDESPLPVTDTSAVQMFLDGRRVWLTSNPLVQYSTPGGWEKVRILFTPALGDGYHTLAVSAKDASGNAADSIPYQVRFRVASSNRIDQVLPYPSPTAGAADFTFRVVGAARPERATLKLYTVAGRMIRDLTRTGDDLRIGFNRIRWDGRDADGAELANGVYLYTVTIEQGGAEQQFFGRIAVLK